MMIAERLRERLTALDMSQTKLAKKAELSKQVIHRYLNGSEPKKISYWFALANALNCSVEYLAGVDGVSYRMHDDVPMALAGIETPIYEFKNLRDDPVIYFLCEGDEVVYVGQTTSLSTRLVAHIQSAKQFSRVFFTRVDKKSLLAKEAFYISRMRPRFNIVNKRAISP